jgi:hypothetical protein
VSGSNKGEGGMGGSSGVFIRRPANGSPIGWRLAMFPQPDCPVPICRSEGVAIRTEGHTPYVVARTSIADRLATDSKAR